MIYTKAIEKHVLCANNRNIYEKTKTGKMQCANMVIISTVPSNYLGVFMVILKRMKLTQLLIHAPVHSLQMKHFFAIFPLVGLLLMASGCDTLRRITAGKGDATAVAPVEYNTGDDQMNYVLQFKDAAVAEMERAGVPASITLAQGILESASGKSELAREANNHFGVKLGGRTWAGAR